MKTPYEILGLTPDATPEELKERYEALKADYSEGRFKDGEEGNQAAKNLTELEKAWADIQAREEAKQTVAEEVDAAEPDDLKYVDGLIKAGRYDEAQAALDGITTRDGEWHYLQSIIYYKREWLTECKAQLEAAINCDPYNNKYKLALDKLNMVMGSNNVDPRTLGQDNINGQDMYRQQDDTLANCCLGYCLLNSCCNAMRCCG